MTDIFKKRSGVYKILNVKTGNFYIGSSVSIEDRILNHSAKLRAGKHANKKLQIEWTMYGEECFSFSVVEECSQEANIEREQFYIDTLFPYYNVRKIANSNLGMPHTEETKRKISIANKGRSLTQEHKTLLSFIRTGIKLSEDTKKKMSEGMRGNKRSLGIKRSEETKKKMSLAKIGKKKSEETRLRMSLAKRKGKVENEHN